MNGTRTPALSDELEARFWSSVTPTGFCWEWDGTKSHGYGQINDGRKRIRAHRFSYELLVGRIPDGMVLDHLCRNKACVNPDHLEAVTQGENAARGFSASSISHLSKISRGDYCPKGHWSPPESWVKHAQTYKCADCLAAKSVCVICNLEMLSKNISTHYKKIHGTDRKTAIAGLENS